MKIEKTKLIDSLTIARMGIAGSDHLEQLGHFIFGGEHLITFNNRILIYHPFVSDFQCSVRAELFYKQLQKFSTEILELTLKQKKIFIEGEMERAQMAVQLEKDSEIFEIINAIRDEQVNCEFVKVPDDFIQAVDFCSYSASKNAADGTLCCVCIDGDKLVSTDNYRATRYSMDKAMTNEKVLLDARVANEIKRFKMTHFGTGTNWLHFKNEEGVLLSARRIFGDYPDISSAFDFEFDRIQFPPDVGEILEFLSPLLASQQQLERRAKIEIKNGLISASVDRSTESAEKSISLGKEEYNHIEMEFVINVDFFDYVLKKVRTMRYNLDDGKAMFQSGNFQHVLRLIPEETAPPVRDVSVGKEEADNQSDSYEYKTDPFDDDIPF